VTNNQERHTADIAQGKWRNLLPQLGVDAKYLVNKHGPCPICGGKDRFRFDDKDGRGRYICNSCGAGDGFQLVQGVTGKSFTQIAKAISDLLGDLFWFRKIIRKKIAKGPRLKTFGKPLRSRRLAGWCIVT